MPLLRWTPEGEVGARASGFGAGSNIVVFLCASVKFSVSIFASH